MLPVLPMDRSLIIPMVHADDVADAIVRVVDQRVGGTFNLAAEPPVTRDDVAAVLRARPVHLPSSVLRLLASGAWHARLQPVDPGWLDLAFTVPLLDTTRARTDLGWAPSRDARSVLAEAVEGMVDADAGASPALRPRSVPEEVGRMVRQGLASHRRLP
jgi:nucleoside-diphosphate-sugar epimerase